MPVLRHFYRHLFLYTFLAIQVLFLVWIISAGAGAAHDINTTADNTTRAAKEAGTGIGIALVIGLWVAVDVILGVGRLVVVTSRRHHNRKAVA